MAEPTVRMPGIVLASLMFQHLNSDSDVVRINVHISSFHMPVKILAGICISMRRLSLIHMFSIQAAWRRVKSKHNGTKVSLK